MRDTSAHPARRSIRLQKMDYSHPGAYFLTFCAFEKRCIFGTIEGGHPLLNTIGEIARACWVDMPNHFPNVKVHDFVVMPNHMHGILGIEERARRAVPLREGGQFEAFRGPVPGSIPTIMRSYKSAVTKQVRDTTGNRTIQVWQSTYFERVLRNGEEFKNASRYILENPIMWHLDKVNPTP